MTVVGLTVLDRSGEAFEVKAVVGQTLMEALRDGGYEDVFALCGGACACATCHVYISEVSDPTVLMPLGDDENDLLDGAEDRRTTSRLSCQVVVTEGLGGAIVAIAPEG